MTSKPLDHLHLNRRYISTTQVRKDALYTVLNSDEIIFPPDLFNGPIIVDQWKNELRKLRHIILLVTINSTDSNILALVSPFWETSLFTFFLILILVNHFALSTVRLREKREKGKEMMKERKT